MCEAGYYCPAGTKRVSEFACPSGTYNSNYGSTSSSVCTTCPSGYFCPKGSASPTPCFPGFLCTDTGLKSMIPCPGGTYQNQKQQTICTTCPQGAFCPTASVYPQLCPPGTYNDFTGIEFITQCKACPNNHLCSIFGLSSYSDGTQPIAEPGYLSPLNSKYGQELPCPPGTYDTTTGTLTSPSSCTACPAGVSCREGTSTSGVIRT